ncbi:MAG: matrixin family metalloprotease, partial [Acetobacteraceae bacterium]|nr:matrixin family metalloprotease [Acetobacteraceae bacterium]
MSADHAGAELEISGLRDDDWSVESAMIGAWAAGPVPRAPLDSGSATLIGGTGRSWNGAAIGTPVLVPYSFATRDSNYWTYLGAAWRDGFDPTRSEAFDVAQRASVLGALELWEQACGVTFIEVPDAPDRWFGGIRFQLETLSTGVLGETLSWRASLSDGAQITLQRKLYADDPLQPGNKAFQVLLHEIGHAIGLKHPFEGSPVLPTLHDNSVNTVMSYTDIGNYSQLGRFDVAAAQYLYGTQAAEDALAVRWSRGPGGTLVSTGNDDANTITGLGIRDIVRAGGGNDAIRTGGGNDDILPGDGSDTVWGGDGMDTVWAEAPRRHATLVNLG